MHPSRFPATPAAGLCLALLSCLAFANAGTLGPKPGEIRKIIHAKVSVGADGRVTDVAMAEKKVPPAIEQAILTRVKGWQFDPVRVDGKATPSVTYAAFYACALKAGDGYDLSVKYLDNGPLLEKGARFEFQPVVSQFSKQDQTITVKMTVLPNGRVQLQDVAMIDVAPAVERDLRISVRHWVEDMRYAPEQVGGKAVATPMEFPLWIWSDIGTPGATPDNPLYAPAMSDPCSGTAALRNIPHPVDGKFQPRENGAPVATPPAH